ncbi:MAG: energy transducer TonB [Chloroflexota bacterium]
MIKFFIKIKCIAALVALIILVSGSEMNAQSADEVFVVADEMPIFPGGQKALMESIYSHIIYPADARSKNIEGKVTVRFVINKEGKAEQVSITKGLCASIDKEVMNAITKIPKFIPGKIAGKAVSVWYAVPVTFRIVEME